MRQWAHARFGTSIGRSIPAESWPRFAQRKTQTRKASLSSLGKKTGIPDHRLQVLSSSATLITERNRRDVTQLGKIFEQEALFERLFEEAAMRRTTLLFLDELEKFRPSDSIWSASILGELLGILEY